MSRFDGVIIGAGHNGLTLGAYMARAGLRVCVLERNAWMGGGCTTDEPMLPGFRCNLHSNFYIGFSEAPLVRDLELNRFGFATIEPPVQQGLTMRDGTALTIHKDLGRSCASIARISQHDADAFRALHETYAVKMKSFFKLFMHVTTGENVPGTGLIFPTIMAAISRLALPASGSASLPLALARLIEATGGEVRTGADVREIVVEGGRAVAVRLADGTRIDGTRLVASGIDAPTTIQLAGENNFPTTITDKLAKWHWGDHRLVTLHLALNAPPRYASATFDPDIERAFNVFFGFDDTEQVVRCFDQCRRGEFPDVPMGNGACNSIFDPTYAPAGKHVAFWWPFAPYALPGGPAEWDRCKGEYTARLLEVWRGYAPNLTASNVLATHLFTPLDIERRNSSMKQGAVRLGAYIPSQLGINRPHALLADNRTPVEGLYLCGSSNHGGGANGAPGYNAANAIATDLKIHRPWVPVAPPEWNG